MDWEGYYLNSQNDSLHELYDIMPAYIFEIIGREVVLPYKCDIPIVADVCKYELPATGKPHDVILDNTTFMRSKVADFYQAEFIYKNFKTDEYFTKVTEVYDNCYDVEVELLTNDFANKHSYALYFFTFRRVVMDNFDEAMDKVIEIIKK